MLELLALAWQLSFPAKPAKKPEPKAEIVSFDKVWDRAPHNAFTDLTRFRERFYLAFREGSGHDSDDGVIRVLSCQRTERWEDNGRITYPAADLRDPKLTVTPDNRLMLTAAARMHSSSDVRWKTAAWFSTDGRAWEDLTIIGEPEVWMWRVSWHQGRAYGMGYSTAEPRFLRSYIGAANGKQFTVLNPSILSGDYVNESSTVYLPDETAVCLLRRDPKSALLGTSRPPYRGWTWDDLGVRIGGPHLIQVPDGRLVAAVRLYEPEKRTSLCWVNLEEKSIKEFLALPSGGDTSYAGLVYHEGLLHVSYYSSHEGRAAIYFAKVKLP